MTDLSRLDERRRAAAQNAYEQYDFGTAGVEGADGWEWDTPGNEWRRRLYFTPAPEGAASDLGQFTVRFEADSDAIAGCHASCRGEPVGNAPRSATRAQHQPKSEVPRMPARKVPLSENFRTLFDVSTGHITSKDADLLRRYGDRKPSDSALIAYSYEYGWTVSTSGMLDGKEDRAEKIEAMRAEGFSDHFVKLMEYAADRGAVLVRLDQDADYEPGLPVFNWENNDEIIEQEDGPAPGP